jgi:hypothetical protein
MRTIEYHEYILRSSHIPEIVNNEIKNGLSYGGLLLRYVRYKVTYKEISLGKFRILIPIHKSDPKDITFLRPFKKFWDVKTNWLTPNNWGKRKNPYLNIWCELNRGDFSEFSTAIKLNVVVKKILSRSKDKELITYLINKQSKFKIQLFN